MNNKNQHALNVHIQLMLQLSSETVNLVVDVTLWRCDVDDHDDAVTKYT